MKTIIHINRHIMAKNRKEGRQDPPITVKTYKDNRYTKRADILDKEGNVVASVVYQPECQLSCGAVAWVETQLEVQTHENT